MMKYVVQCVVCGHRMRVLEEHIGLTGQCGKCGNPVTITQDTVTLSSSRSSSDISATTTNDATVAASDGTAEWKPGDVLLDLYEVLAVLGEGGMGKVYRIHHRLWNLDLAVKSPRPSLLAKARGTEHFERECETWINLGLHPHIVSCYYVRRIDQVPRIFAEFVEGGTLWNWILSKRFMASDPRESLDRILKVAVQIAWGLHHAHTQGVIHRDIKPGNVLMTPDGNAKVTDFGLAIAREAAGVAGETSASGTTATGGMTPMYCSPEQRARDRITFKTDIWSFGLCLLQMFTRKVVWPSGPEAAKGIETYRVTAQSTPGSVPLPDDLARLLLQCFEPDPAKRPESMLEVTQRLTAAYRNLLGAPFPLQPPKTLEAMAHSLNNRAVSFLDLGKSNDALQLWQKALQAETQHVQSTFNLGLIRWRTGRISDEMFVRKLEEVIHLHPQDPIPSYLLAQVHLERGDCVSCLRIADELEKNYPDFRDIRDLKALATQHMAESRRIIYSFDAHADGVNSVVYAPDSEHIYTGSEDNTIKVWSLSLKDCTRTFHGHTGSVDGLSLSADGKTLLSMSRDRTIRLWNTQSGACIESMEGQRDGAQAAALSPDGVKILARGAEDTAIIYDTERIERTHVFQGHIDVVTAVAWSRNMDRVFTASQDGTLRAWELARSLCTQVFEGHQGPVTCLDISPDGSLLVSGGMDKSVRIWHTSTGQCIRVMVGHRNVVRSVHVTDDARYALTGSSDGTVRYWNLESGRCVRTFDQHQDEVRCVAISKNGQFGASVSRDKTLKHWRLTTPLSEYAAPYALCKAQRSEAALSSELHFSHAMEEAKSALKKGDAQTAAKWTREARRQSGFARNPEAMRLWNRLYLHLPKVRLNGLWEGGRYAGHQGPVHSVGVSLDGRWIASGGADATIRVWESGTAKCVRTLSGHGAAVKSISVSDDAHFLLSGGEDQAIYYWDLTTGEIVRQFEAQMGSVECVALSPDGVWAVTGGWELRLYEVATGRPLRVFEGHSADVTAVSWSRDGRYILSGSSDECVRLWDIASGNCVNMFTGPGGAFKTVTLSQNGGYAVGGTGHLFGRAGKIHVWDTASGAKLVTFEEHTGTVTGVSMATDGRFLVSSGTDSTLRIYDLQGPVCIKTVQSHDGAVEDTHISRDGRFVVTAGGDGLVRTWILDWELGSPPDEEWDPAAAALIENFIVLHTPYNAELKPNVAPDLATLNQALTRRGRPVWGDADFAQLLHALGCAGLGWIAHDVVQRELDRAVSRRTGISSIFRRGGR